MARKTREEKVLTKAENIIDELHEENSHNVPLENYEELYVEYRRLSKRYKKSLKINDSMSYQLINQNENLEEDNKNIIKISREKILSTAAEKRHLQEKMSEKLTDQNRQMLNLKKEIKNYKNYENMHDEELSSQDQILLAKDQIKSLQLNNESLKTQVQEIKKFIPTMENNLSKEITFAKKAKESLVFAVLGIDNFNEIKTKVNTFTTVENFVFGILKYLQNSLKSEDVVAYFKGEIFYIISHNITLENMVRTCEVIGRRRRINSLDISLNIGLTQMEEKDTVNDMIIRGTTAYKQAKSSKRDGDVVTC